MKTNDRWILAHTTLQTLGTAGAMSMAGTMVYINGAALFHSVHATLGLFIIAGLVTQVHVLASMWGFAFLDGGRGLMLAHIALCLT
jgi:hypothetical protein